MTYREVKYLADEVFEKILRGMDESEAKAYVYERVGRNSLIFVEVWDKVMWMLDYDSEIRNF